MGIKQHNYLTKPFLLCFKPRLIELVGLGPGKPYNTPEIYGVDRYFIFLVLLSKLKVSNYLHKWGVKVGQLFGYQSPFQINFGFTF